LGVCDEPAMFAIATGNPMKVRSLRIAARRFCNVKQVITTPAPAGLPAQPVGWRQLVEGALARAKAAYASLAESGFGVGVEAGPATIGRFTVELQVAAIVGPGGGVSIGTSQGFMMPRRVEEEVLGGVELGAAAGVERPGDIGESIGYIGVLTRGAVTRQDLTVASIVMALLPWVNGYHGDLPRNV